MESRLLILLVAVASQALAGCSFFSRGGDEETLDVNVRTPTVIDPDLDRREVKPAKIDDENFEVSAYAGLMSIEDFGTDTVVGARIGQVAPVQGQHPEVTERSGDPTAVAEFTPDGEALLLPRSGLLVIAPFRGDGAQMGQRLGDPGLVADLPG